MALRMPDPVTTMRPMPRRQERRPNGAESKLLTVRVPSELLDAAKERAAEKDETLSAAVVAFLRRYSR